MNGFNAFETALLDRLDKLLVFQGQLLAQGIQHMATVDEIIAKIAEETTAIGGIKTLVQSLRDEVAAIPMPAATQAQIDEVFAKVSANAVALADAIATVPPVIVPPVP